MLKRIYIDNFRCLVNFELSVEAINLLLGVNGSGKSAIFEVLQKIQAFVSGKGKVEQIFKLAYCTRWQTSQLQSFELEINGNGGNYKYELAVEHDKQGSKTRVFHERLWFDNKPLIKFEGGEVQLYYDNYGKGPVYPFDWSQSIFPSIMAREDNKKLTWFKERLDRFIIVQIIPPMMVDDSEQEEKILSPYLENYVSWYRYLSQDQGKTFELMQILKEVIDDFAYFKFEKAGKQNRILEVYFAQKHGNLGYRLSELSDGQKALIALWTLITCTKSEDYTLCLDEPENFLALPEIQPFLMELYDLCGQEKTQALLISHHPELMDILASSVGYWFERPSQSSPTRVKRVKDEQDTGLTISELVARGWLND